MTNPLDEYQAYRVAAAAEARPHLMAADAAGRTALECYANAEFWAGWNAAISHAARIAEGRHHCWQESTIGCSAPDCDVTACEDIGSAIRAEIHRQPCASRPPHFVQENSK
jgi:hypothetical protein